MKTDVECLACFVRQALQVSLIAECPPALQYLVVQQVAAIVATLDKDLSPPDNAGRVYRAIAAITGCEDPYRQHKIASNEQCLNLFADLRREIRAGGRELAGALRFAIAGNCIDYGAFTNIDIQDALTRSRQSPLAVDHTPQLRERIALLEKGAEVLYLADNSGEIVYDRLLVEYLFQRGLSITVAVKDGPIINDALMEDAVTAGLDRFARIISNGTRCPGTVLHRCSSEFNQIFVTADLVIAKGQGNFESLSEVDRDIFFLLTIKCGVAARHLAALTGVDAALLPGKGEMVVYYSDYKVNGYEDTY